MKQEDKVAYEQFLIDYPNKEEILMDTVTNKSLEFGEHEESKVFISYTKLNEIKSRTHSFDEFCDEVLDFIPSLCFSDYEQLIEYYG